MVEHVPKNKGIKFVETLGEHSYTRKYQCDTELSMAILETATNFILAFRKIV